MIPGIKTTIDFSALLFFEHDRKRLPEKAITLKKNNLSKLLFKNETPFILRNLQTIKGQTQDDDIVLYKTIQAVFVSLC
jgi:hypothetical protein